MHIKRSQTAKRPSPNNNIPNEETLKAMQDTDEGKNLVECENFDDFVNKLKE